MAPLAHTNVVSRSATSVVVVGSPGLVSACGGILSLRSFLVFLSGFSRMTQTLTSIRNLIASHVRTLLLFLPPPGDKLLPLLPPSLSSSSSRNRTAPQSMVQTCLLSVDGAFEDFVLLHIDKIEKLAEEAVSEIRKFLSELWDEGRKVAERAETAAAATTTETIATINRNTDVDSPAMLPVEGSAAQIEVGNNEMTPTQPVANNPLDDLVWSFYSVCEVVEKFYLTFSCVGGDISSTEFIRRHLLTDKQQQIKQTEQTTGGGGFMDEAGGGNSKTEGDESVVKRSSNNKDRRRHRKKGSANKAASGGSGATAADKRMVPARRFREALGMIHDICHCRNLMEQSATTTSLATATAGTTAGTTASTSADRSATAGSGSASCSGITASSTAHSATGSASGSGSGSGVCSLKLQPDLSLKLKEWLFREEEDLVERGGEAESAGGDVEALVCRVRCCESRLKLFFGVERSKTGVGGSQDEFIDI
eukprot:GHVS01013234.1.p1 GENE.GHVS01013234.1~~GHVS01013234.1.p1  ORF type:complete len:479 (+),score=138.98 GHVS01013234.1:616-2052(+)